MGKLSSALISVALGALAGSPAAAQFNTIFGDPPRPPGAVPQQQLPPPQQQQFPPQQQQFPPQQQQFPQQQQQFPQQRQPQALPPPAPANLPQQAPARDSSIRSEPLPPPPGATAAPPPLPGPSAGFPQTPLRGTPAPADASPQPGDEVVVEPPAQKIVNKAAVFAGLDKITGRIISFDVNVGETVQFGALQVTPRACYTRPPTLQQNTDGFVEIDEVTLQGEVKRLFTGWMFTASPGLHAVEHPIYDVWLTDCKSPDQPAVAAAPEPPPPAATPARSQRPPARAQQPLPKR